MNFPTISLYAIPLTLSFQVLWAGVTRTRSALSVSIGDAGNVDLLERVRP